MERVESAVRAGPRRSNWRALARAGVVECDVVFHGFGDVDIGFDVICLRTRSVHADPARVAVGLDVSELQSIVAIARMICMRAGSHPGVASPAAPLQRASGGGEQAGPHPLVSPVAP